MPARSPATMRATELAAIMAELGIATDAELARRMGVDRSAATRWLKAERAIPGPAANLARLWLALHRRTAAGLPPAVRLTVRAEPAGAQADAAQPGEVQITVPVRGVGASAVE